MSYQAEISRANPTCFFFLIDQSSSMLDPIMGVAGNPRKAEFVADCLNKVIQTLVVTAAKEEGVRRYFQIGALGYGSQIGSGFGNLFGEQELVWIDELAEKPLQIEERKKRESDGAGGVIEVATKFPIWIDAVANGQTPMCAAFEKTKIILEKWSKEHRMSYPPTVINLTDGEANDGDPRPSAEALKSVSTSDGNVILMTLHASSNQFAQQVYFPSSDEGLPDNATKLMYEVSSPITEAMGRTARDSFGLTLQSEARALVYNAPMEGIVSALEIGTLPANLR